MPAGALGTYIVLNLNVLLEPRIGNGPGDPPVFLGSAPLALTPAARPHLPVPRRRSTKSDHQSRTSAKLLRPSETRASMAHMKFRCLIACSTLTAQCHRTCLHRTLCLLSPPGIFFLLTSLLGSTVLCTESLPSMLLPFA